MSNEAAVAALKRRANDLSAIKDRFMTHVEINVVTGCWLWLACGASAGSYGFFWFRGRQVYAHRASYEIFIGPIPKLPSGRTSLLRHSCDDRRCVNYEHLTPGTNKQNMQDAVDRGRIARGSRNGNARLAGDVVAKMKAEYVADRSGELTRLADKYGTTLQNVRFIVRGETWVHIEPAWGKVALQLGPIETGYVKGSRHHNSKLSEHHIQDIHDAKIDGVSNAAIGGWFGLKKAQVSAILHRRFWAHVPLSRAWTPGLGVSSSDGTNT